MAEIDQQTIIERVRKTPSYDKLRVIEANITKQDAMTPAVEAAIKEHYGTLARQVVAEKAGIKLENLTPAEEKIVLAVAEYVGLMKRDRKAASRTFQQLKNRGLIGAAEAAVSRAKPTQGFTMLNEADRADLSYEQIILDHPDEFSERAVWFARRALGLDNATAKPPAEGDGSTQARTEILLNWLKSRRSEEPGQIAPYTNADAAQAMGISDMAKYGRPHGNIVSRLDIACCKLGLPPIGLTAEQPFEHAWKSNLADWDFPINEMQSAAKDFLWSEQDFLALLETTRMLPGSASSIYKAYSAQEEQAARKWADSFRQQAEEPFWVLVCNPQKWAIDAFLARGIEVDSWGVRPSDKDRFKPGQLAIIRVGQDRRSKAEREGRPPLEPGIYALCQVLTEPYPATGASDEFWSPGSEREPGWPTVGIRYLRTFLDKPLPIETLKAQVPHVSRQLLDGFQASTFPISGEDFRAVTALLGVSEVDLPDAANVPGLAKSLADIEDKYRDASPEVKERQSRYIERGPVGAKVKKLNSFKCQICDALGHHPHAFLKPNGEPYVEAHHVMPVSKLEKGSLHAANIMTLCANHHRQLHFGGVEVEITDKHFTLEVGGVRISIPRPAV